MKRRYKILLQTSLMICASACTTMGGLQSAKALKPHKQRMVFDLGYSGVGMKDTDKPGLVELGWGWSYGVIENVETGLRLSSIPLGELATGYGAEGYGKYQLPLQSLPKSMAIATAFHGGYRYLESYQAPFELVYFHVPLLLGYQWRNFDFNLIPAMGWQQVYSVSSEPVWISYKGAAINAMWLFSEKFGAGLEIGSYQTANYLADYLSNINTVKIGIGLIYLPQ